MAATAPTFSLVLISLLSLSTNKIIATYINPLSIPSCIGHPGLLKCAYDVESAIIHGGFAEISSVVPTISLALDSINAAKASYINALHFLPSKHFESGFHNSLKAAFSAAIHEADEASKVLLDKHMLHNSYWG